MQFKISAVLLALAATAMATNNTTAPIEPVPGSNGIANVVSGSVLGGVLAAGVALLL